jgi:hypothetical protein
VADNNAGVVARRIDSLVAAATHSLKGVVIESQLSSALVSDLVLDEHRHVLDGAHVGAVADLGGITHIGLCGTNPWITRCDGRWHVSTKKAGRPRQ